MKLIKQNVISWVILHTQHDLHSYFWYAGNEKLKKCNYKPLHTYFVFN